jgi:transposase InsO family protein
MQTYHSNSRTNVHVRSEIMKSNEPYHVLAQRYNISKNTVSKWHNRSFTQDKSSKPNNIKYAIDPIYQALIYSIRTTTWMPLDEIEEVIQDINSEITRSSIYRFLKREGVNKKPLKEREKAKKFKEYEPGFIHLDVTYLPKFQGQKYYLFVAIDRATRTLFYKVYENKTAESTDDFVKRCKDFFPFKLTHILTDNGLEFTNKLLKSKKGELYKKPSKLDKFCEKENIEHRLTKVNTPKTNGMVERVNGTIKSATILKQQYPKVENMIEDLNQFLIFYLCYRRHGGLKKELNVKTPLQAIYKWYEIKPELFLLKPQLFEKKILNLKHKNKVNHHDSVQQPCET